MVGRGGTLSRAVRVEGGDGVCGSGINRQAHSPFKTHQKGYEDSCGQGVRSLFFWSAVLRSNTGI